MGCVGPEFESRRSHSTFYFVGCAGGAPLLAKTWGKTAGRSASGLASGTKTECYSTAQQHTSSLLEATESVDTEAERRESYADKAATWKLALYWTTNRRFWSCSESITNGIDPNDHTQEPDVREAVRWCSLDSVRAASETSISDAFARRRWDDLDDLDAAIERVLSDLEVPAVRSTLPDEAGTAVWWTK